MGKLSSKRQKIILLFLFGIGCPSLILGYLAFRGIRNDQALLEKERLMEHRQIAQQITESVADSLKKIEAAFFRTITNPKSEPAAVINSINQIKDQNRLIEAVFTLDNFEKITFPTAKLPYSLDRSLQSSST